MERVGILRKEWKLCNEKGISWGHAQAFFPAALRLTLRSPSRDSKAAIIETQRLELQ